MKQGRGYVTNLCLHSRRVRGAAAWRRVGVEGCSGALKPHPWVSSTAHLPKGQLDGHHEGRVDEEEEGRDHHACGESRECRGGGVEKGGLVHGSLLAALSASAAHLPCRCLQLINQFLLRLLPCVICHSTNPRPYAGFIQTYSGFIHTLFP